MANAGTEILDLSGCDQIVVTDVLLALTKLTNVEHLLMTGCRRLDLDGLMEFCDHRASSLVEHAFQGLIAYTTSRPKDWLASSNFVGRVGT